MKRFMSFMNNLEERVLVISLMFNLGLILVQVVMRYVFSASLSWSEELARYIFLWQIWVGTSWGVKERRHIRVDALPRALGEKGRFRLEVVVLLIWALFSTFIAYKGGQLCRVLFTRNQLSPAMRIPIVYAYLSVPAGCALMAIRLFAELYKLFSGVQRVDEVEV
ncbi:MAG: TRAP transporter small permease [Synergistaceae bacterium]|jgi:TRAP-type C4-dicarboxylate transport system permease small subunit|nr:TRAP transporter small permease [Synergistaceae bacterium]